jgi:hypothetical protein
MRAAPSSEATPRGKAARTERRSVTKKTTTNGATNVTLPLPMRDREALSALAAPKAVASEPAFLIPILIAMLVFATAAYAYGLYSLTGSLNPFRRRRRYIWLR